MKYIVILGDGMSDYPIEQLGGKTPLQAAATPTIDFLAARSEVGLARTIPDEMPPGSDTANLAVMGYNPREFYTGRSPFEAASMGVLLDDTDVAFRCNLVTLSGEQPFAAKTMVDYCAEEISSAEAARIIESVNEALGTEALRFYPGVSYRNLLTWKDAPDGFRLTPPHDITGRPIRDHLPKGPHAEVILGLMAASATFLADHPVNRERVAQGLRPANSIWIWGEGKKPRLSSFAEKYGVQGSVISAVDLVKGIGVCAGLRVVEVPGATGNIHTNFVGKAMAAVQELKNGQDFVYVHLEAPDEGGPGHPGADGGPRGAVPHAAPAGPPDAAQPAHAHARPGALPALRQHGTEERPRPDVRRGNRRADRGHGGRRLPSDGPLPEEDVAGFLSADYADYADYREGMCGVCTLSTGR